MPDPNSDRMNAMFREAAGRGRITLGVDDQAQQPAPPVLGGSDYSLRDSEPLFTDHEQWDAFMSRRQVVRVLDQAGRLPGERGYDRHKTGPADPGYDLAAAIEARRRVWKQRGLA